MHAGAAMIRILLCLIGLVIVAAGCARTPEALMTPTSRWDHKNIETLIAVANNIASDGLDPAEYDVQALEAKLFNGENDETDVAASGLFLQLAFDLYAGAVPREQRLRWHVEGPAANRELVDRAEERALRANRVAEELALLAPIHSQYWALKTALAKTSTDDIAAIERLRLNLERWRWMPRNLGPDYILVNVPAFDLTVVKNGAVVDRRRIIAGAEKTPTPQFAAMATGIAFNPTWFVPQSIVAEGIDAQLENDPDAAKRRGYYFGPNGGVRQRPGPNNALGQVKLVMPNHYSIFLHDTPAKSLFNKKKRALSHGCIRIENAVDLAQLLLKPNWRAEAIDNFVSSSETVTVDLEQPIPVYVAYFTATADDDGSVSFHPDIYGLDLLFIMNGAAQRDGDALENAEPIAGEGCPVDGPD